MATGTINTDCFMPGDSITYDQYPVFFGYVGGDYGGNFYVFLPKAVSPSVTNVTASYSGPFGWIMRDNMPLGDNMTIVSASKAGANLLSINFTTTNTASPNYFEIIALNVPSLTITFS